MLKLALKNIFSKPLRTLATILAIAVVVAMIFCMISFKGAVFDYEEIVCFTEFDYRNRGGGG